MQRKSAHSSLSGKILVKNLVFFISFHLYSIFISIISNFHPFISTFNILFSIILHLCISSFSIRLYIFPLSASSFCCTFYLLQLLVSCSFCTEYRSMPSRFSAILTSFPPMYLVEVRIIFVDSFTLI